MKIFLQLQDYLEKNKVAQEVYLICEDPELIFQQYQELFTPIEAAGGVVFNTQFQILCIYRRGYWDLPKGKIDPGETIEQAALREVIEETGVLYPKILKPLPHTWHTYREPKQGRILKRTHWYAMQTQSDFVQLQKEEDIESHRWIFYHEISNLLPIYPLVKETITTLTEHFPQLLDNPNP